MVGVEDEGGGFAGDAVDLHGVLRRDEDIPGGGVLDDVSGEFASITKADQVEVRGLGAGKGWGQQEDRETEGAEFHNASSGSS